MPPVVQSLGGPVWLVSLIPALMLIGFRLPPIFIAHHIESMRQFKPLLLGIGILQRAPYGVAAGVLLWADRAPMAAIAAVALSPFLSGLFGGLGLTAWQQLVLKTVPEGKRPSLFGIRFGIACGIGIVAGKTIAFVLSRYPGMTGYAILHLCAFLVLMLSYAVFSATREPHDSNPPPERTLGFREQMLGLPTLLGSDRQFLRLLVARFFLCGTFVLSPFLAIYCQGVLNEAPSFLGKLVVFQMLGAIIGSGIAGWLGNRFSSKVAVLFGIVLFIGMTAWSTVACTPLEWEGIFFLFGFAFFASEVGNNSLGLEMGPVAKRATYLAIGALVYLPGMLCASAVSTLIWRGHHRFDLLAIATILWLVISGVILIPLREPRHARSTPEAKESPL